MKSMVNKKINNITVEELLQYSAEYEVAINHEQAVKIVALIRSVKVDIYNDAQRLDLLKRVAQITSPATAKQLNELFQKFG
ncbi:MAG: DUF2624 domain-containing protein [Bacillaceae bacterium]